MARPDYAQLGFTVDVQAARKLLRKRSLAEVYDLVRTGLLIALHAPDPETGRRELLFHQDEILTFLAASDMRQRTVDERLVIEAFDVLNEYLTTVDPMEDYEDAVTRNAPLHGASKSKSGEVLLIRPDMVTAWHNGRDEVLMSQRAPVAVSSVETALMRTSAVKVRGVIALADSGTRKQRWAMWWRVPQELFTDAVPDVVPTEQRPDDRLLPSARGAHIQ